jgi:hypothetical protein
VITGRFFTGLTSIIGHHAGHPPNPTVHSTTSACLPSAMPTCPPAQRPAFSRIELKEIPQQECPTPGVFSLASCSVAVIAICNVPWCGGKVVFLFFAVSGTIGRAVTKRAQQRWLQPATACGCNLQRCVVAICNGVWLQSARDLEDVGWPPQVTA